MSLSDLTSPGSTTVLNGGVVKPPEVDPHFDKKLLTFIFLIVLACLMFVFFNPQTDIQLSQATLVTVLTGALTTILGAIIGLTQSRQQQRSADTSSTTTVDEGKIETATVTKGTP